MTEVIGAVSAGVTILFLIVAGLGFLSGFMKGTLRSILDIGVVILNLLLSMLIATSIAKGIADTSGIRDILNKYATGVTDPGTLDIINGIKDYIESPELNSDAVSLLLALATVIALPIVFMIVYFVLGLILKIPKIIIQKICLPKAEGFGLKLGGGAIGLVSSVISLAIFLIPITGYVNYAYDTVSLVGGDSVEEVQVVLEDAKDVPMLKAVHVMGGKALFRNLTTVTVSDVKVSLTNETENGISVYKEANAFIGVTPSEYGDNQITALDNIEELINEMEFFPALLSSTASFVALEWEKGNDIFGMEKPQLGDGLQDAFDKILDVLAKSDVNTFKKDTSTVIEILKHAIDDGIVQASDSKDTEAILNSISKTDVVSNIFIELHRNERMRPIIPALSNVMINYIYDIYDEVNGTETQPHEMVDINSFTEEMIGKEGEAVAKIIYEINLFLESVEGKLESESMIDLVTYGDFAALGRGFNAIKYSRFFGDAYEFMLRTVLESRGCAELGIVDDLFISTALNENSDMEKMLVARQKTALLVLSLDEKKEIHYGDAVETLILNFTSSDASSIKNIITEENLKELGLNTANAHTISGLLTSMVDTLERENIEFTDENRKEESEKVGQVLTAVTSALENKEKDKNVFKADEADAESTSNMSATEFVDTSLSSELVSNMIVEATKDDEGNEIDDPYHVKEKLSDNDINELKNALGEEYNKEGTREDEEKMEKLGAIAHIFGIDTSDIFN